MNYSTPGQLFLHCASRLHSLRIAQWAERYQPASSRQPVDAPMTEAKLTTKRPARHPSSPHPLRCRKTCPPGRAEPEDCCPPFPCRYTPCVKPPASMSSLPLTTGCESQYPDSSLAERQPLQLAPLGQPKRCRTAVSCSVLLHNSQPTDPSNPLQSGKTADILRIRSGNPQTCCPTSALPRPLHGLRLPVASVNELRKHQCFALSAMRSAAETEVRKRPSDSLQGQKSPLCRLLRQEETRRLPPPD